MHTVREICQFLEDYAPPHMAEDWDNVGLLIGDRAREVRGLMTCLTVTPESVAEATGRGASMIVTHHPLPFRPLKTITADSVTGRMLLDLIEHKIAVYSPHTAFDSAAQGINQWIAEGLGLADIAPLVPFEEQPPLGSGRYGTLPGGTTLGAFTEEVRAFFAISGLHCVGADTLAVTKVAVACGSAGQFLATAARHGCDCLITGETNFHTCLEAKASGVGLVLPGHFASERFAVERLADRLRGEFPNVDVWASDQESDPLSWHR